MANSVVLNSGMETQKAMAQNDEEEFEEYSDGSQNRVSEGKVEVLSL